MNMRLLFFLIILFGVPYLEIMVFLEVGALIGGWSAFGLTLLSAFVGIWLIRLQGLDVLRRMQAQTAKGEVPVTEMVHGFLLLVAGFFFLLPGFITDSIALLLSLPPLRQLIIASIFRPEVIARLKKGPPRGPARGPAGDDGIIIEGEFYENKPTSQNTDQPNDRLEKKD